MVWSLMQKCKSLLVENLAQNWIQIKKIADISKSAIGKTAAREGIAVLVTSLSSCQCKLITTFKKNADPDTESKLLVSNTF
jgi:hypothetical protein